MKRHNVTLTDQVSELVATQVSMGRFKDFSAAINEIVFTSLAGSNDIFREYGVTPAEVDAAAENVTRQIAKERKAGKLTPFE